VNFTSLNEKIKNVPSKTGCYLWLGKDRIDDKENSILYIGKAKSLKTRLKQYLKSNDYKTQFLMSKVVDVEWIITNSEIEALLLESNLIKKHNPPYNVRLKDDKRYPYLCLTMSEMFPRFILTRRKKNIKNIYFGPYADVRSARNVMNTVHKLFPIRKRHQKLPIKNATKPCLNYHIDRCWAPCTQTIDKEDYNEMVLQIKNFLEDKDNSIKEEFTEKMIDASEKLEFEKAARYRNILEDLEVVIDSKQNVHNEDPDDNFDIIGLYVTDNKELSREILNELNQTIEFKKNILLAQVVLLKIRNGNLIQKQNYAMTESSLKENKNEMKIEFLEGFFRDYYLQFLEIPKMIYLSLDLLNKKNWESLFSKKFDKEIKIIDNQESKPSASKVGLIKMALSNAKHSLRERILKEKLRNQKIGLRQIQKFIGLKNLPLVIECYDISNIQGKEAVGAGVMLKDGLPHKSGYRKYKILSKDEPDDPAMMYEVIVRRMTAISNKDVKAPDLIVIDGGKTQLRAAIKARDEFNLKITIVGLAKKREEIHTEDNKILQFDKDSPGMQILRLARDESHRFGVAYHRSLRMKRNLKSFLDDISGLGEKEKSKIMSFLRKIDLSKYTQESLYQELLKLENKKTSKVLLRLSKKVFT